MRRRVDGMTRRQFLVAMAATAAVGAVGCTDSEERDPGRLRVLNWPLYIDDETVARFEADTRLTVDYVEEYEDNYTALSDVFEATLGEDEPTGFDVIVPTYWVVDRLVGEGWLEPIPIEDVPNHVNIDPDFLGMPWDRGARFHMPWQVGITGIAYVPERVERPIEAVEDLFAPDLAGRVGMVLEMRESVGLVMLTQGADPSRATTEAAERALERIARATADGQIAGFTADFATAFTQHNLAACLAWSGDIVQLQQSNPELGVEFVIPAEGAIRWFDSMIIPNGAANVGAAARWMNFVYDPANAARITVGVQYISPVRGVHDELAGMGGEAAGLASNPILFPDDETRRRLFFWSGLDAGAEDELDTRFADTIEPHLFGA
ncbi:MAG: polyamine ABC transporter substrate-binding protein [Acidimicrobiales bacterium]